MHFETLEAHQRKHKMGKDVQTDPFIFIAGASVAVQWEDGGAMDVQCNSQTQEQ